MLICRFYVWILARYYARNHKRFVGGDSNLFISFSGDVELGSTQGVRATYKRNPLIHPNPVWTVYLRALVSGGVDHEVGEHLRTSQKVETNVGMGPEGDHQSRRETEGYGRREEGGGKRTANIINGLVRE